jgi:hypothetical protein
MSLQELSVAQPISPMLASAREHGARGTRYSLQTRALTLCKFDRHYARKQQKRRKAIAGVFTPTATATGLTVASRG